MVGRTRHPNGLESLEQRLLLWPGHGFRHESAPVTEIRRVSGVCGKSHGVLLTKYVTILVTRRRGCRRRSQDARQEVRNKKSDCHRPRGRRRRRCIISPVGGQDL